MIKNLNKIFIYFLISLILILNTSISYAKSEKDSFQEIMKELLVISGKIKKISQELKPSGRLYIHQQLPAMYEIIKTCDVEIHELKNRINSEILDDDLYGILNDSASLEVLSIKVTKELLDVYSEHGAITAVQYNNVVKKYENEANRLKKSLKKYKNM